MNPKLNVYTALGSDDNVLCYPIDEDFKKIRLEINGVPRQLTWKPIPMRIIHKDEEKKRRTSDSPWIGTNALIFRPSAIEALGPILRECGELLPLSCAEAELWIYNPTCVIDALDEKASTIERFNDGSIMMIERPVFKADVIGETDIFKIPNTKVSSIYFSQRFIDRWKMSGLKGLDFVRENKVDLTSLSLKPTPAPKKRKKRDPQ